MFQFHIMYKSPYGVGVEEARRQIRGDNEFSFSVVLCPSSGIFRVPVRSLSLTEVWESQSLGDLQLASHVSFWLTSYASVHGYIFICPMAIWSGHNSNASMVDLGGQRV